MVCCVFVYVSFVSTKNWAECFPSGFQAYNNTKLFMAFLVSSENVRSIYFKSAKELC